jgi:hypothetical protein
MAVTHPDVVRSLLAEVIRARINSGGGPGRIEIYTTGRATLLGTVTCAADCGTVTDGDLVFAAFTDDPAADSTGLAAIFDAKNSAGALAYSGAITATGSGGDMTMLSTSITAGEPIRIISHTYRAPL